MPAISVDTFFACSLMVLLVLAAMAGTSKLLYPYMNLTAEENVSERYRELSKYMLLNSGTPSNWGQDNQTIPETFGLAKNSGSLYELDIDKVTRLNIDNNYSLNYAQIFTALRMPDAAFKIEIKPIFEVNLNLTATFAETNETIYQFEIMTEKHGAPVLTELKCYTFAQDYFDAKYVSNSNGKTSLNISISNSVTGPALIVAFAKSVYDSRITSFNAYGFAHNSAEPEPKGTFLRLSPLNYTLAASFACPQVSLSESFALTFNYYSTLTQTASNNGTVTYNIPCFLDSSPTLIVVTGQNDSTFFAEWTTYPQIPLQVGANFADFATLSNVFVYPYIVTINRALYECTMWLGGLRNE